MKWNKGVDSPKEDGIYVTRLIKPKLVSALEFVSAAGGWNTSYKPDMFEWLDESPSPSGADSSVLVKELESIINSYDHDEDAHKYNNLPACRVCSATKALAQYKSQPGSLQGELEKDYKTALEETRESLSELIRSMGRIENGSPMKDFDKERLKKAKATLAKYWEGGGPMIVQSQSPEHKSDSEPEGIDIVKTENELLSKCLNMLRYLYMNEYCGEHGPEVSELIKAK